MQILLSIFGLKVLKAGIKKAEVRTSAFGRAERTAAERIRDANSAFSAAQRRKTDALAKESAAEEKTEAGAKRGAADLKEKGFSDDVGYSAARKEKGPLIRNALIRHENSQRNSEKQGSSLMLRNYLRLFQEPPAEIPSAASSPGFP